MNLEARVMPALLHSHSRYSSLGAETDVTAHTISRHDIITQKRSG